MSSTSRKLSDNVVLRFAGARDDVSLRRLAELDSTTVPPGRLLLAEVDGALRAAYSPEHGAVIADPFHPTAHLIALLQAHGHAAAQPPRRPAPAADPLRRRAPWPA
jgi:hypothetical protein